MSDFGFHYDSSPMSLPSCMYSNQSSISPDQSPTVNEHIDLTNLEDSTPPSYPQVPAALNTPIMAYTYCNPPNYIESISRNHGYVYPNPNLAEPCPRPNIDYPNTQRTNPVVKRKRNRTAFTTNQLKFLEEQYRTNRYVDRNTRMFISEKLKVGERIIKIWFQNRRMKEKKDREGGVLFEACSSAQSTTNSYGNYELPQNYNVIVPPGIGNVMINGSNECMYVSERSYCVQPMETQQPDLHSTMPFIEAPLVNDVIQFKQFTSSPPPNDNDVTSTVFSEYSQYLE